MADITPEKYYSPNKIARMHILPWISPIAFRKRLQEQHWKEFFNPIIEEKNGQHFIYIKGEYIIKFLEFAANGQLNIVNEKQ